MPTELGERLRDLAPAVEVPLDPMARIWPRIRRRRRVRRCVAAAGIACVGVAVVLAAVFAGEPRHRSTVVPLAASIRVGELYGGPPFPHLAESQMWVVATGDRSGTRWVVVSFANADQKCAFAGTMPDDSQTGPVTVRGGYCADPSLAATSLSFAFTVTGASGQPQARILVAAAPAPTASVRVQATTGTVGQSVVGTISTPFDRRVRLFTVESAPEGFVGKLTLVDGAGRVIAVRDVRTTPPPVRGALVSPSG